MKQFRLEFFKTFFKLMCAWGAGLLIFGSVFIPIEFIIKEGYDQRLIVLFVFLITVFWISFFATLLKSKS